MEEEVYTTRELAAAMGISRQAIITLKRNGTIPANAITPDGSYIKSVVTPLIEAYTNASPPADGYEIAKSYSPEIREKVVRMLEQNLSNKQIAEEVGCGPEAVRRWRIKYMASKSANHPKQTGVEKEQLAAKSPRADESTIAPKKAASVEAEDVVRGYWQEGTRAVDVLLLPPEIGPTVLRYVNEALRYAHDRLK